MQCRRARPGLGTIVEITVDCDSELDANGVFDEAFASVEDLEAQLSAHRADSTLNCLCDTAHLDAQKPGVAVYEVLKTALELHQQSQGIFDVAGERDSSTTATPVSSADIRLDADGYVCFMRPLRIDLGGIAKGYVIDRVTDLLQTRGCRSGSVNAGGDLRIFGDHAEPVALRFADGFRTIAQLREGAFAASRPGLRPMSMDHHGETHYDGRSRKAVSTPDTIAVFAPLAVIADALTKIALVSAEVMDRLCADYSAEWRRYPFKLDAESTPPTIIDAA